MMKKQLSAAFSAAFFGERPFWQAKSRKLM